MTSSWLHQVCPQRLWPHLLEQLDSVQSRQWMTNCVDNVTCKPHYYSFLSFGASFLSALNFKDQGHAFSWRCSSSGEELGSPWWYVSFHGEAQAFVQAVAGRRWGVEGPYSGKEECGMSQLSQTRIMCNAEESRFIMPVSPICTMVTWEVCIGYTCSMKT